MSDYCQIKSNLHMESFVSDQSDCTAKIEQKQTEQSGFCQHSTHSQGLVFTLELLLLPAHRLSLSFHLLLPICASLFCSSSALKPILLSRGVFYSIALIFCRGLPAGYVYDQLTNQAPNNPPLWDSILINKRVTFSATHSSNPLPIRSMNFLC